MDRDEAIKATKNGAIAAVISGTLTLIIVVIATQSIADGQLAIWNDPVNYFDIVFIFACAIGVYKRSRTAAIVLFVYFILAKIMIGLETGSFSGLALSLIFLYFYGKAIQGAFAFHRLEKEGNPNYKATSKWVYFVVVPLLVIVGLLVGVGILTMTSVMPSTEVQAGAQIFEQDKQTLIENGIIYDSDSVSHFYSTGFTSILEGGTLLTDDRVILYKPDENEELEVYEIFFKEVVSIDLIEAGSALSPSLYQVNTDDPDRWIIFELSTENDGDVKFVESLRRNSGIGVN